MPKKKGIYVSLPDILYRDAIDKLLFGYVMGFRNRNLGKILEVREACQRFMEDFNISEDQIDLDSAVKSFYRMFKEYQQIRDHNGNSTEKGS